MSRVAVCTDSTSLLTSDEAAAAGVAVVPATVVVDGDARDEPEVDLDAFYESLAGGARATTAQPAPGRLLAAYEGAAAAGAAAVVSVHLDPRLSGTVDAARLAARDAPIPVLVVDTGTASRAVAIVALWAATRAAEGASAEEIAAGAPSVAAAIDNAFFATGAARGRIATSDGALLRLKDGRASVVAACAAGEAAGAIAARLPQGEPLAVAVGHAHRAVADAADALARQLAALPDVEATSRYRVGASVGAHAGPWTFGAFWHPLQLG